MNLSIVLSQLCFAHKHYVTNCAFDGPLFCRYIIKALVAMQRNRGHNPYIIIAGSHSILNRLCRRGSCSGTLQGFWLNGARGAITGLSVWGKTGPLSPHHGLPVSWTRHFRSYWGQLKKVVWRDGSKKVSRGDDSLGLEGERMIIYGGWESEASKIKVERIDGLHTYVLQMTIVIKLYIAYIRTWSPAFLC